MDSNPCNVCGGTDLNLVDGFYYCVECGTQDVNVRETVVEQTVLADGTFAHATAKKLTVLQDAIEMSGEWNKWHAYNFILAGLTEELLKLGAEPDVKTAVLWIWTKYIKMFQVKENNKSQLDNDSLNETNSLKGDKVKEVDTDEENDRSSIGSKKCQNKTDKFKRDIKVVTKGTLLTILYVALNLSRSEIQLSHLLRFIKEGRLSLYNCTKFVPDEINTKSIPKWKNFILCQNDYTPKIIRTIAMTFFKRLKLGVPILPDLNKMVSNYVKELCLPADFKILVLSLLNLVPCDFLVLDKNTKSSLIRIPDYEGVCMSYVLVALKMCFGLDAEYELKVSNEVDKINYDENHSKCYKLGSYSEPTNRLFSFQDWYQYLLFRKTILCKYYLPMARLYKLPVDDSVLMEHLNERKQRTIKLSDNVTMDIINKINIDNYVSVIPKREFPATLTPMSTYTEVILEYLQDPDLRLLLCEDFTKYSLKYAINDLKLPECYEDNIIQGISETNKTINPFVIGTLKSKTGDTTMVFVRNCENKNWLKTKPPTVDHIIKVDENKINSDKESDLGYDSNMECTPVEYDETQTSVIEEDKTKDEKESIFEHFEEEKQEVCIFDDEFNDFNAFDDKKTVDTTTEFRNEYENYHDTKEENSDTASVCDEEKFNPETFDRNGTINRLIEIACEKYKIPLPRKSELPAGTRKRKQIAENYQDGQIVVKKKRTNVSTGKRESRLAMKKIVAAYYKNLENDILHNVSKYVNTFINNQVIEGSVNNEVVDNTGHNFEQTEIDVNSKEKSVHNDELENDPNTSIISSIHPNSEINDTRSDEEITEDITPKIDPKFDPKTHDIEQLYVKLNKEVDLNYMINFDSDPELHKIMDKTIAKSTNIKSKEKPAKRYDDTSDSDDDLPLINLLKEKEKILNRNKMKVKTENLINNSDLQQFNYWMRHYRSRAVSRSLDMNEKFDIEISENCPKSFVFIISECAAILDCTTFSLYKCMQNLEETLIRYCNT